VSDSQLKALASTVSVLALIALQGCAVRVDKIRPTPTTKPISTYSCEQLTAEKVRIEAELPKLWHDHDHETVEKVGVLKGEAIAVNDAAHAKNCGIAEVVIPRRPPASKKPLRYTGGSPDTR
jgi:hypothetical protein